MNFINELFHMVHRRPVNPHCVLALVTPSAVRRAPRHARFPREPLVSARVSGNPQLEADWARVALTAQLSQQGRGKAGPQRAGGCRAAGPTTRRPATGRRRRPSRRHATPGLPDPARAALRRPSRGGTGRGGTPEGAVSARGRGSGGGAAGGGGAGGPAGPRVSPPSEGPARCGAREWGRRGRLGHLSPRVLQAPVLTPAALSSEGRWSHGEPTCGTVRPEPRALLPAELAALLGGFPQATPDPGGLAVPCAPPAQPRAGGVGGRVLRAAERKASALHPEGSALRTEGSPGAQERTLR
ncbi:translation initiation factor IF-2-like [Mustela erminea]|uniref:translation initiation factor IF-2-like n=1 Tax=Mustela erminea TaxID=36723 RepID=UPI001387244C|nr:translation initiation factor IF-2-like [Mustela erminea]XP_032182016.1 translation initiation factor IF-2-like [Mustela erminea]